MWLIALSETLPLEVQILGPNIFHCVKFVGKIEVLSSATHNLFCREFAAFCCLQFSARPMHLLILKAARFRNEALQTSNGMKTL